MNKVNFTFAINVSRKVICHNRGIPCVQVESGNWDGQCFSFLGKQHQNGKERRGKRFKVYFSEKFIPLHGARQPLQSGMWLRLSSFRDKRNKNVYRYIQSYLYT